MTQENGQSGRIGQLGRIGQIGIDESGKGDYFGPLVIAGVYVSAEQEIQLQEVGVRDSKTLADKRATTLSEHIRRTCPYTVVAIGPERYNSMYASFKNLNRLLAWGPCPSNREPAGKSFL